MISDTHEMPLDPQLAKVAQAKAPPPFSGSPEEARARMRMAIERGRQGKPLPEVSSVEDTFAIGEMDGVEQRIPVRIYRPVSSSRTQATIVFFHGGGFVLGSIEMMDDLARKLCRDTRSVLVSVDYRLAPEHPFPAAHDDALVATEWVLRNVGVLGNDSNRVVVAGESAGANLASYAALMLSRAAPPRLAAQLLVVPGVDMARDIAEIEARGIDYPMLKPQDLRDIARLYMGDKADQAAECPPSPIRADSLKNAPPALIAVAGHDPLKEEGLAYADALSKSGVAVKVLAFESMFHLFFGMFEASDGARDANDKICRYFTEWIETHALACSK